MAKIPTDLSGRRVLKALRRAGFEFRRQRGSHMIAIRSEPFCKVTIPDHKAIRIGTLRKILAETGLTVEQFVELL